jgi:hypothetical protein
MAFPWKDTDHDPPKTECSLKNIPLKTLLLEQALQSLTSKPDCGVTALHFFEKYVSPVACFCQLSSPRLTPILLLESE